MKLFKNIKKKLKKINNSGSSIVMVVVALAFIGVIFGALLSAAMYGYREKLQDVNAKNNFYNVEQAMNEIYAGVGVNTIAEMQRAYSETLTGLVYFNPTTNTYESLSDDSANYLFRTKFMNYLSSSDYFKNETLLASALETYITNDTVKLDKDKLMLEKILDENGNLDKIVIRNVTLTRTQEYKNAAGEGTYTQTVAADIEVVKPDFYVNFTKTERSYPAIFDYALIGDTGVEISKFNDADHYDAPTYDINNILNINGNIYGAADYYNHKYNDGLSKDDASLGLSAEDINGGIKIKKRRSDASEIEEKINNDDSLTAEEKLEAKETATNIWFNFVNASSKGENADYNGEKVKSMFSGLYLDNATVSIVADQIIVPGSLSVMNKSDLTVYSGKTAKTEIWADEVILGGESNDKDKVGSTSYFNADMYVRDDTELNSYYSDFTLNGSYYGYGDSTSKDNRTFVSSVNKKNFTSDGTDSTSTIREHYNSSAIIVNGEHAQINLANANTLYLAGRTYIELSKTVSNKIDKTSGVVSSTYKYNPTYKNGTETEFIRDYQTAESISVKNNQLMYELSDLGNAQEVEIDGKKYNAISFATLGEKPLAFLQQFFPLEQFADNIPCITQKVGTTIVNYIDFNSAYDIFAKADADTYKSVDAYAKAFVKAYSEAMTPDEKDEDAVALKAELTNILTDVTTKNPYVDTIKYGTNTDLYSSGAITTKVGSSVSFKTETNDSAVYDKLLSSKYASESAANLAVFNDDLENQYLLRKWTLNYDAAAIDTEDESFIKNVVSVYGESAVTPINYYMLMNNLSDTATTTEFDTAGGHVWISGGDIFIDGKSKVTDEEGNKVTIDKDFTGIIISKGDVTLGYGLKSFKGTIIAGGKIFVDKSIKLISAGGLECKDILDDCLANKNDANKLKLLKMFKMYDQDVKDYEKSVAEGITAPDASVDVDAPKYFNKQNIESIDYSQVVSLSNWQKTVGGGTDAP